MFRTRKGSKSINTNTDYSILFFLKKKNVDIGNGFQQDNPEITMVLVPEITR